MRVHLECHEPHLLQVVHDPLHILAIVAEVAGEPRNGLGAFGVGDGSEDLPAGARQPEPRHHAVACHQEEAVQPEHVEDEVGQGLEETWLIGIEPMIPSYDACRAVANSPNSALFKSDTAQNDIPLWIQ